MSQPRIFVTYLPERTFALRQPRRTSEPMAVVMAGALLVGGGMHSLGHEGSSEARSAATPQWPSGIDNIAPTPLPYLAFVAVVPPQRAVQTPPPPRAQGNPAPVPELRPPATRPRRDLAGFLEGQGLTLEAQALAGHERTVPLTTGDQPSAGPALAGLAAPEPKADAEAAAEPVPGAAQAAAVEALSFPIVEVAGQPIGAVTMRGDSIHLASLVGLLELKLPAAEFERLRTATAADSFVDLEALHAAGLNLAVDADGDRLMLSVI